MPSSSNQARNMLRTIGARRWVEGGLSATVMFVALGTVAALWQNPLFVRMTPVQGPEVAMLGVLAALFGLYVAIRRPACSWKGASTGSILGFLGVACPVCNKILLLLFGGELLMAYFEPVRLYVTVAGIIMMVWLVGREWRLHKAMVQAEA